MSSSLEVSDPLSVDGFSNHPGHSHRGPIHHPNESTNRHPQLPSLHPFFHRPEAPSWNPNQQGSDPRKDLQETFSPDFSLNSSPGLSDSQHTELIPSLSNHRHSVDSGFPFTRPHGLTHRHSHVDHDFQNAPSRSGAMTARAIPNHHRLSFIDNDTTSDFFDPSNSPLPPFTNHQSMMAPHPNTNGNNFSHVPNSDFGFPHPSTPSPCLGWDSETISHLGPNHTNNNSDDFHTKWSDGKKLCASPFSPSFITSHNTSDSDCSPASHRQHTNQSLPNFLSFPEKPCSQDPLSAITERFAWSSSSEHNVPLSVFVGNIPKNTSPEAFHRLMSLKGSVIEVVCDFRPDCWLTAFVTYSKPSEAAKAVEFFNNRRAIKTAPPHRLVCCFAPHPPASLCCSPTPTCRPQELKPGSVPVLPFFPKFGPDRFDHSPALRRASPRFSLLKDGPPGANLFIYGIPSDWTEVTLMRLCQEFGHIVGIRVPGAPMCQASGPQRLNKGFGFVSYDSTESSARALEALSGRQFLGKPLNIQLKLGEQLSGYSTSNNNHNSSNVNSTLPITNQESPPPTPPYWNQLQNTPPLSLPPANPFSSESFINFASANNPLKPPIQSPHLTNSDLCHTNCPVTPRSPNDVVHLMPHHHNIPPSNTYRQSTDINTNGTSPWNHLLSPSNLKGSKGNRGLHLPLHALPNNTHSKQHSPDIRCEPWMSGPPLSCRSVLECSNMSTTTTTADDETPLTTATSTPEQHRVASLRPSSGESSLSSAMLPDRPDIMSQCVMQQSTRLQPNMSTAVKSPKHDKHSSQSSLLSFVDSPHLLNSVLGLFSSDTHNPAEGDVLDNDQHQDSSFPLRPTGLGGPPFHDLFAEDDLELWKLLEQHWSQSSSANDGEDSSLFEVLNRGTTIEAHDEHHNRENSMEELKVKDAAPSHEDLKALFDQWRKNSLTRNHNSHHNNDNGRNSVNDAASSCPTSNLIDLWRLSLDHINTIDNQHHSVSSPSASQLFSHSNRIETELSLI